MDSIEPHSQLSEAFSKFNMSLYQKMIENREGNFIFSPLSVQIALSALLIGSSEETSTEIQNALKYEEIPKESIIENFKVFMEEFRKNSGFNMVTKLAVKKDCLIKPTFQENAMSCFCVDVEALHFDEIDQVFGEEVVEKAEDLVQDLIKPEDIDDSTSMILSDAICFSGTWHHKFNSAENFTDVFFLNESEVVDVEYMTQRNYFKYGIFYELKSIVIEMLYECSHVSLLIILPESRNGIVELEEKLKDIDFMELSSKLEMSDVKIQLPKFRIEFKSELTKQLREIGISRAFEENAEFSEILELESDEKLNLSKVIHKCCLEVNEKGTESMEASQLEFEFGSIPNQFDACQPFVFALKTKTNVVFIGRCCEPKI